MAVGIVVVSHSRRLAEAAVELAMQMVHGDPPPVALAAGTSDGGLGTDATAVMAAITQADQGDGVAIFVDLGSALMSAELGVELHGDESVEVRILAAPFVEGLLAGIIRAAGGASLTEVAREAEGALTPKQAALGVEMRPATAAPSVDSDDDAVEAEAVLVNETGLHARPAALLAAEASKFDAEIEAYSPNAGPVAADSSISLMLLDARKGQPVRFSATGPDAARAVEALADLVRSGFGE